MNDPKLCPVCNGSGNVPYSLYNPPTHAATSLGIDTLVACRSCAGCGYIIPCGGTIDEHELRRLGEVEAEHKSLRHELARIYGTPNPREGQSWTEAMLELIAKDREGHC